MTDSPEKPPAVTETLISVPAAPADESSPFNPIIFLKGKQVGTLGEFIGMVTSLAKENRDLTGTVRNLRIALLAALVGIGLGIDWGYRVGYARATHDRNEIAVPTTGSLLMPK